MDSSLRETTVYGTLVEIEGIGVLLVGRSGSGKSDAAAKLLLNGRRLVADDVVIVHRREDGLFARASDQQYGLMNIRGIGIVKADLMFGSESVVPEVSLDIIVEITEGLEEESPRMISILGIDVAIFTVANTRDIAAFTELAALSLNSGALVRLDDIGIRTAA